MEAIVQGIVNRSKLEVTHIKITDAKADSFLMSIVSEVTGTGPVGATMAPMTVEMHGPGGMFGRLDLPEIKTASSGTTVKIDKQLIKITDMEAFKAFSKAITQDKELVLKLENGKTTIKAMFMSNKVDYRKETTIKGMEGPKTYMDKFEPLDGGRVKLTMSSENPSPLEIELGNAKIAMKNAAGETIGEVVGPLYINRGQTTFTMEGTLNKGVSTEGACRWVGQGNDSGTWTSWSVQLTDVPIELNKELVEAVKA